MAQKLARHRARGLAVLEGDLTVDQNPSVALAAVYPSPLATWKVMCNLAGSQIQRLQVVKAWLDDGEVREAVFDVAGDPGNQATVDFATCTPQGAGFDRLCTLWEDPDFSADEHALYYARVIENPSCRWQHFHCLAAGANCSDPSSVSPGLEVCCDPAIPRSVQERAWSSPIWYTP